MRKLGFNQFNLDIHFSSIRKDFVIIQLTKDESWLSYQDVNEIEDLEDDDIDEELIENETIHSAIKSLPDGCRAVVCLHLLEGFKHKEIAEKLGISESTSKTQYRHAKALLKKKLIRYYEN